ncbi:unnamed protein product [Adineta steineri]|uniref:Uncharacterized protein n=1 Tax=Adineta steineri TaxID=433720 RepID=A0A815NH76_9BILA|nr:unnamed protein product [Adineta steineri]CAF1405105.1 unnamed protein product [Adineta steineri]CAF1434607.1 unnamed protein product [Adineta steineri]CAF1435152.1 unnamed protein product [Adineta steineri]
MMDIQQTYASSSVTDSYNNESILPPSLFSFESTINSSSKLTNNSSYEKDSLLDEQLRFEKQIAHESSIKTQNSFITTYTSLQTILSQTQLKLATIFLQETEYLKFREQQLEYEEQSLTKRMIKIENIQNERKQIENEFNKIKDRLEMAVIQLTKFQNDGVEILQKLFNKSHQIDEQLSGLICQCVASLNRSQTIIHSKINEFSQKSNHIQSELTNRQVIMRNTQLSITLILELVTTLNQFNVQHSQDITMTTINFEKQYQQFINTSEMTKNNLDINKEMNEIHVLEKEKIQLEEELLEQTILLENIHTIIGKVIIR